jgi:hypothetical protein
LAETVERVSVDTAGNDANDTSFSGSIDEDGRYVAFSSDADDLVPTDAYGFRDIFVRDLVADTTELVSVDSDEVQGNDDSYHPSIRPDGRYVAFQSLADNLVAGDTNTASDVFVRDLVDGVTSRVNVSSDGTHAKYGWSGSPSITTDDEFVYVAYCSDATNLTDDDTNGKADVFVSYFDKDLPSAITTRRASVNTDGTEATNRSLHPRIAVDGGNVYVAYISDASDLVGGDTNKASDIFVSFLDKANLDTSSVVTQRVSVTSGGGQSSGGGEPDSRSSLSISADGRYVAYDSWADDLVGGDTNGKWDVFVTDWNKSDPGGIVTERVSVATDGSQAGANVSAPSISGDGRYVAFKSLANNLVEDDTNGKADVFVRDRMAQTTVLVSTTSNGGLGNGASGGGSITPSAGDALPMVVLGTRRLCGCGAGSPRSAYQDRELGQERALRTDRRAVSIPGWLESGRTRVPLRWIHVLHGRPGGYAHHNLQGQPGGLDRDHGPANGGYVGIGRRRGVGLGRSVQRHRTLPADGLEHGHTQVWSARDQDPLGCAPYSRADQRGDHARELRRTGRLRRALLDRGFEPSEVLEQTPGRGPYLESRLGVAWLYVLDSNGEPTPFIGSVPISQRNVVGQDGREDTQGKVSWSGGG